jgi:hypothetical protein
MSQIIFDLAVLENVNAVLLLKARTEPRQLKPRLFRAILVVMLRTFRAKFARRIVVTITAQADNTAARLELAATAKAIKVSAYSAHLPFPSPPPCAESAHTLSRRT